MKDIARTIIQRHGHPPPNVITSHPRTPFPCGRVTMGHCLTQGLWHLDGTALYFCTPVLRMPLVSTDSVFPSFEDRRIGKRVRVVYCPTHHLRGRHASKEDSARKHQHTRGIATVRSVAQHSSSLAAQLYANSCAKPSTSRVSMHDYQRRRQAPQLYAPRYGTRRRPRARSSRKSLRSW